jgi:AraC-like DNA-binding protein
VRTTNGALELGSSDPAHSKRRQLVELLEHFAAADVAPWPGLTCFRTTRTSSAVPSVYTPSICVVGQGVKLATLGKRTYRYDPFHYLVTGAHMPVDATIVEASDRKPFLSLRLGLDPALVRELLADLDDAPAPQWDGTPPLRVSPLDDRLLDAIVRFLQALRDPMERRVLAPAALREIVFHTLTRDQGELLRIAADKKSRAPGVERALHYIHRHLEERLEIGRLAREAGMSSSAFHQRFKAATTMSPIQYVKRMRLHLARQLMVDRGCLAAEAAFRVGYESPSHFSRDFKRLFGQPPRRYFSSP